MSTTTIVHKGVTFVQHEDSSGELWWELEQDNEDGGIHVNVQFYKPGTWSTPDHEGWTAGSGGPFIGGFANREEAFDEAIALKIHLDRGRAREALTKLKKQRKLHEKLRAANPNPSKWVIKTNDKG